MIRMCVCVRVFVALHAGGNRMRVGRCVYICMCAHEQRYRSGLAAGGALCLWTSMLDLWPAVTT